MSRERQPGWRRFLASGHPLQGRKNDSPLSRARGPSTTPPRPPRRSPCAPLFCAGALPKASVGILEETRDLDGGLEGPIRPSRQRWIGTTAEGHRAARWNLLRDHVVPSRPRAIGAGVELVAPEPIMPDEQAHLLQPMPRGVQQGTRNGAVVAYRGVSNENLLR